jgi:hypothetical protein
VDIEKRQKTIVPPLFYQSQIESSHKQNFSLENTIRCHPKHMADNTTPNSAKPTQGVWGRAPRNIVPLPFNAIGDTTGG